MRAALDDAAGRPVPGDRARLLRRLHPHRDRRDARRRRSARSRAACGSGWRRCAARWRAGQVTPRMSAHGPHGAGPTRRGAYLLGALARRRARAFEAHLDELPAPAATTSSELQVGRRRAAVRRAAGRAAAGAQGAGSWPSSSAEAELLAAAGRAAPTGAAAPRAARGASAARWLPLRPGARAGVRARAAGARRASAGALLAGGDGDRTVVAHDAGAARAEVELQVARRRSATLRGRDMPAPPQRPRLPGVAQAPGPERPSRPTSCGRRRARRHGGGRGARARSTASRRCSSPTSPTAAPARPPAARDHRRAGLS